MYGDTMLVPYNVRSFSSHISDGSKEGLNHTWPMHADSGRLIFKRINQSLALLGIRTEKLHTTLLLGRSTIVAIGLHNWRVFKNPFQGEQGRRDFDPTKDTFICPAIFYVVLASELV